MLGINGNAYPGYLANPKNRGVSAKDPEPKDAKTADPKTTAADPNANPLKAQVDALKAQAEKLLAKTSKKETGAKTGANGAEPATENSAAAKPAENGVVTAETETGDVAAASASFMDRLKEMQGGFINQLMESLGLGSLNENGKGVNLADGLMSQFTDLLQNLGGFDAGKNGYAAMGVSAQYSLNISAVMSVMNADGSLTQQSLNFSLEASFDYLSVASGKGGGANSLAELLTGKKDKTANKTGEAKASDNDFLAKMREMFSPEKTAQRILDFSLGFFGNSKWAKQLGDTEESRGLFTDYIGAAIQKGFDQAMGILGKNLPSQTKNEVDQTHSLVFQGLDDFRNGKNPANKTAANNLQYFTSSLAVNYSSTSVYYSPEEVKKMQQQAASVNNPYANAKAQSATDAAAAEKDKENAAAKTDALV